MRGCVSTAVYKCYVLWCVTWQTATIITHCDVSHVTIKMRTDATLLSCCTSGLVTSHHPVSLCSQALSTYILEMIQQIGNRHKIIHKTYINPMLCESVSPINPWLVLLSSLNCASLSWVWAKLQPWSWWQSWGHFMRARWLQWSGL